MKNKELEIGITGRVQGVNFRYSVKKFADDLNLKGFIENRDDGNVQVIVQGDTNELRKFLFFVQSSPGFSRIEELSCKWKKVGIKYPDFRIVKNRSFVIDKIKSLVNLGTYFINKKEKIPLHVSIIPDGNRRWAREKGFEDKFGHYKSGSYISMESLFNEAKRLGVKCVSIWGFSTENWKRSTAEKKAIFDLILEGVEKFRKSAKENRMRFRHVGRKDRLPGKLIKALESLEKETLDFVDFTVQLCLDYGGRDEIVRAVNKILKSDRKEVSEEDFSSYLDTVGTSDPDLIIRTSGEKRLSGFMPFQAAYAELYFSEKFFPEFGGRELRKAVREYSKRVRRFGGDS